MILGVQSDEVRGYSGLMQAMSQYTLAPAHINLGSIDVVTPSLIWQLEDDPRVVNYIQQKWHTCT